MKNLYTRIYQLRKDVKNNKTIQLNSWFENINSTRHEKIILLKPATSETFTFVNYQERLKLFEILWISTLIWKQLTRIKILLIITKKQPRLAILSLEVKIAYMHYHITQIRLRIIENLWCRTKETVCGKTYVNVGKTY